MAVKNGNGTKTNVNKTACVDLKSNYCFLATAVILAKNNMDEYVPLRVLFDGASQASFITSNAAKLLGVPSVKTHLEVTGVHGTTRTLRKAVKLQFKAAFSTFAGEFYLPINPFYTDVHPAKHINIEDWAVPENIKLADPSFNVPGPVDILLNAHTTYEWQSVGQIKLADGLPLLQKTLLGWIVVGNYGKNRNSTHSINLTLSGSLDQLLTKFWTLEEITMNERAIMTPEERACEQHYVDNVQRNPDGRFVVKLPFRIDPANLGNSYGSAHRRFNSLRHKLSKDNVLREQYAAFMDEYQQLGHCVPEASPGSGYVIPHFHVVNPDSTTTKLRVVFDASAPSSNGLSLNDALMVGPCIQRELIAHLVHFRCKSVAITGDISKMYRQIGIAREDQQWQKIIWANGDCPPRVLQLTTVTYGTAPASFLATRVLTHLADEETVMLTGAKAIRDNMYVDDLLSGADTPADAIKLYEEVKAILAKGQLPIRKFCSNSPEVMAAIPAELHGSKLKVGDKDVIKTLGLLWLPESDVFSFHYEDLDKPVTKRGITSVVASIFDPLGLVAPCTILGKTLTQRIWVLGVDWDESLPQAEATLWAKLREEFVHLSKLSIPRYVLPMRRLKNVTLHGFGDASKTAYGVVFYVRVEDEDQNVSVRILCAKARVAPLKTISLPRLELLSGQLLSKVCNKIKPWLPFEVTETYLWLDASIALTWILGSPHKWTSFVATRVTRIQNWTPDVHWRHVPTDQNPADIASRGMLPSKLAHCSLWLDGPSFLQKPPPEWPNRFCKPDVVPEVAPPIKILSVRVEEADLVAQSKYHSWGPLQRVFSHVHQFISCAKAKVQQRKANAPPPSLNKRQTSECKLKPSGAGCQTPGEYPKLSRNDKDTPNSLLQLRQSLGLDFMVVEAGLMTAVKIVQQHHFVGLIEALTSNSPLPKQQRYISKLHPFIDREGFVRVGGRLGHSEDLSECSKYPLLLPAHHPLTTSLFLYTHHFLMHGGPQAMLGYIYTKFWPLKAKIMANRTYSHCLRCQWIKPTPAVQQMGQLPRCRVSLAERPFVSTGVDYFEPLWISQPGRGRKPVRAYVCLFVCMTTKAIHMELVDDLSTPGFLNAFQRFVSRRGMPSEMFSDHGRNFCGARNLLYNNHEMYNRFDHWQAAYAWCRSNKITWRFIPPRTPHQGGLWEAAVKSAKYHLVRAVGQASLYRSEMETVLTTVEAILNSRPLIPVSPHPEDGAPLTPGHFLIGWLTLAEPYLVDYKLSNLERYKRVVAIKQVFWQKWSREYLNTLRNHYKWTDDKPNLQVDDYVLLVDKNTKPRMWNWGKVLEVKQAADGKVRSAKVKTIHGTYERGITELCPLPFEDSSSSA